MSSTWAAILLAGAGTFLMRASFLLAAHRLAEVPEGVQRVLRQIPPAALAALVVPALLRPEGELRPLAAAARRRSPRRPRVLAHEERRAHPRSSA